MRNLDEKIRKANLPDYFEVSSGDCGSIAQGIRRVFGGNPIVVHSQPDSWSPCHIAVEVDDILYDGTGRVSGQKLVNSYVSEQFLSSDYNDHITAEEIPDFMIEPSVADAVEMKLLNV